MAGVSVRDGTAGGWCGFKYLEAGYDGKGRLRMEVVTMVLRRWALSLLLGALLASQDAHAIAPEDGPAYMTDTHGASGVCWFLEEMIEIDPVYERYYYGALDWLVETAQWDGDKCWWLVSTTAPEGHPNHKYTAGGGAIFGSLAQGYMAALDERYSETALGGIRALLSEARASDTSWGPGFHWGQRVGHSHGPGGEGDMLLDAYEELGEQSVLPYVTGLLNWMRDEAVFTQDGLGNDLAMWPEESGGTAYETGYCYGNAGSLAFVIHAANSLPDLAWTDGKDLRWLVNANLRWLISVAVDVPPVGGLVWRYMRHDEMSTNIGFGSGVAGIGIQFLKAAQLNRDAGDPFADECLEVCRKAVAAILYKTDHYANIQNGACGGEGGTALLLLPFADEIEASDPGLAQACRAASGVIGERVLNARLEFGGRSGWKSSDKFGDEAVNIALDYGSTGLGMALAYTGTRLGRTDLTDGALEAAEYLRLTAVWDEAAGCKWPQIVPYGPVDSDGDGIIDDWDAFPVHPDEAVDSDSDAMGDHFEWLIIDDNPDDLLVSFGDVLADDDYDNDTITNVDEFLLGLDPTDGAGGGEGEGEGEGELPLCGGLGLGDGAAGDALVLLILALLLGASGVAVQRSDARGRGET